MTGPGSIVNPFLFEPVVRITFAVRRTGSRASEARPSLDQCSSRKRLPVNPFPPVSEASQFLQQDEGDHLQMSR
jgi:hypothetical protein